MSTDSTGSTLRWGVWTEETDDREAHEAFGRLVAHLPVRPEGVHAAPYLKTDGHTFAFTTASEASTWAELVLEAIVHGQHLGSGWLLTGDAEHELSGWSNDACELGIVSVSWDIQRGDLP